MALVTDNGLTRHPNAITVNATGVDWWPNGRERGLGKMGYPVEAYAVFEDEYYPIFWCGLEMGSSTAEAVAKYKPGICRPTLYRWSQFGSHD